MCILKHTYFLGLPFPSEIIFLAFGLVWECFNITWFFTPQEVLHPKFRPFAHVLSAGQDLVSYTHYLTLKRKNPGVFSSRVFWILWYNLKLTITPLKRSRNAWNTIHATIRMRPGGYLGKHGFRQQWTESCFHLKSYYSLFIIWCQSSKISKWLRVTDSHCRCSWLMRPEWWLGPTREIIYLCVYCTTHLICCQLNWISWSGDCHAFKSVATFPNMSWLWLAVSYL